MGIEDNPKVVSLVIFTLLAIAFAFAVVVLIFLI